MSQTETLLLLLVGFSLAALVFLALARLLWHAGLRMGARRMRDKVPQNVAELRSERDSLRGEYARLSQKLNARLQQAKLQMAEQMAEVARHRNRLATMVTTLNDRDAALEQHSLRIAALEEDGAEKERQLAAQAQELAGNRDELAKAEADVQRLTALLAAGTGSPASVSGDQTEIESGAATPASLRLRIDQLAALSHDIASQRETPAAAALAGPADPLLQEKLDAVARETADLQQELNRLDASWSEKLDVVAETAEPKARAVANVINLARRIKSQQPDKTG